MGAGEDEAFEERDGQRRGPIQRPRVQRAPRCEVNNHVQEGAQRRCLRRRDPLLSELSGCLMFVPDHGGGREGAHATLFHAGNRQQSACCCCRQSPSSRASGRVESKGILWLRA